MGVHKGKPKECPRCHYIDYLTGWCSYCRTSLCNDCFRREEHMVMRTCADCKREKCKLQMHTDDLCYSCYLMLAR